MSTKTVERLLRLPTPAELATAAGVTEAQIRAFDSEFIAEATMTLLAEQSARFQDGTIEVVTYDDAEIAAASEK